MITFAGLASGIDSAAIVDELVNLSRLPARRLEERKADTERQISIVAGLSSDLKELSTSSEKFTVATDVRTMAATTSDDTRMTVTSSATATPGTHSLRVSNLASAQTSISTAFPTANAGEAGAGTLSFSVAGAPSVDVVFGTGDSLADIATRITDADAGVRASVVFDGVSQRLMVTAKNTGAANSITFSGDTLGLDLGANTLVAANDASFTFNGLAMTRPTNEIADLLPGVSLRLVAKHEPGDLDTEIQIAPDLEASREKMQEFLDSFNSVINKLNAQLGYAGTTKGSDTLFGDSTLRGLQRAMSTVATKGYAYNGGTTSLRQIGINLDRTGTLTLDATAFDAMMTSDPEAIENLFAGVGGADGVADALVAVVETYTNSSDGLLVSKDKSMQSRIDTFDEQIDRIETRAQNLGERMSRQFSNLESMMSLLQAQQASLFSLISG